MKYKIKKQGMNLVGSEVGDIVDMNEDAFKYNSEFVEECEDQNVKSKHVLFYADVSKAKNGILTIN